MNLRAHAPLPVAPALGDLLYAVDLPGPISVNNLFEHRVKTRSGERIKGRRATPHYLDWRRRCGQMIIAQGQRPALTGPVSLIFTLGEASCSPRIDSDNCLKAYIDVLVTQGVLPDDNRGIVRHLSLTWQPGERCCVHIFRWGG